MTRSPWLAVPLADYEGHMSLPSVGQAEMLATQFAALLAEFRPASVAVIGCAGGNGFDRIRTESTTRVVGVDVNPEYIERLSRRYADEMPGLELHVCDIEASALPFDPVDLIYAGLVFEYVALAPPLRNLKSVCRPGGVLATVLQLPSESVAAVSPSPFASVQSLAPVMHFVSPTSLEACARQIGFVLLSSRQIASPSGKKFAVQTFQLPSIER